MQVVRQGSATALPCLTSKTYDLALLNYILLDFIYIYMSIPYQTYIKQIVYRQALYDLQDTDVLKDSTTPKGAA